MSSFANDVVVFPSTHCDHPQEPGQFSAKCEASWDESKHLQIGGHGTVLEKDDSVRSELLPQVKEFKYFGVFSQVRIRWGIRLAGRLVQHQQ